MYAVMDNERVSKAIKNCTIPAGTSSYPNLMNRILLSMNVRDVLPLIGNSLEHRPAKNASIPYSYSVIFSFFRKAMV